VPEVSRQESGQRRQEPRSSTPLTDRAPARQRERLVWRERVAADHHPAGRCGGGGGLCAIITTGLLCFGGRHDDCVTITAPMMTPPITAPIFTSLRIVGILSQMGPSRWRGPPKIFDHGAGWLHCTPKPVLLPSDRPAAKIGAAIATEE